LLGVELRLLGCETWESSRSPGSKHTAMA
jgi:hypothetical protein